MYCISSSESYAFDKPREIDLIKQINHGEKTYLWVKLKDPLNGQNFGKKKDIEDIILLNRHQGYSLSDLRRLPIDVYILLPKENVSVEEFNPAEMEILSWATVYDNLKDAENHLIER